ncbi:hypothetical protein [Mycolicibacterium psychrotolerans]|nr:hypothetical protein [Mycolicibacterium psychrotolerans]
MRKQMVAAAMASAMVVASVGLAGPAAAQDEWVMPDVRGEVLETAIKDVRSVTGDVELDLRFVPRNVNQVVYNYTNWAVCATSPSRERVISQKTKRVIFSLRRLNEDC